MNYILIMLMIFLILIGILGYRLYLQAKEIRDLNDCISTLHTCIQEYRSTLSCIYFRQESDRWDLLGIACDCDKMMTRLKKVEKALESPYYGPELKDDEEE